MFDYIEEWMKRLENSVQKGLNFLFGLKQSTDNQYAELSREVRRMARGLEFVSQQVAQLEVKMAKAMDDLVAEVAASNAGVESAIVAIKGLEDQLAAAGTDPVKLAELTASLASEREKLAAAIVAPAPPPVV